MKKNKILAILGPTSSGKTKLAVQLAMEFNGEIVSADSRQVYRGMDIGTGKDLKQYCIKSKVIPYYLIDVVSPKTRFNLAKYQKLAFKAIDDILQRGKLPILVGGSGLYLQAVVDNFQLFDSKPDLSLRKKLEKLTINQLFTKIKKLSPEMAIKINNSDKNNKRRLIRYAEILLFDKNFKNNLLCSTKLKEKYQTLIIGLTCSKQILRKRIYDRLIYRLEKEKMIDEIKQFHQQGLSWRKLEEFGLEYKFISLYLQKKLTYDEMVEKLNIASNQFANRQMSWFRRWEQQGKKINWIENVTKSLLPNTAKAKKLIKMFLSTLF
ncbi:tRNA (adenosine(37)-N6)-dimethylallyltransferase MiaA [Patescibacteria group bacterium]|nr:tRNA (adenosine(37)-N6)-dimethylallyltransferase MiaA [Patescibacteria group bacterium]MBU1870617.1 tRNA (adenosine(37)-N6)-dimethylallyltransferase MiaA [Patescibacteria group bacterium]